jgi:uncharacterized membrane protein YeaQ/YmgE (transglycosylase-associated protein family)
MDLVPLIIQLIAGAIGGNAAGAVLKDKSLGSLGNTIAGIVGGGVGGKLLSMIVGGGAAAAGSMDIGSIIQQIAGGGIGGAVLMALVGVLKNMNKS